jgi:hypothetical protein
MLGRGGERRGWEAEPSLNFRETGARESALWERKGNKSINSEWIRIWDRETRIYST